MLCLDSAGGAVGTIARPDESGRHPCHPRLGADGGSAPVLSAQLVRPRQRGLLVDGQVFGVEGQEARPERLPFGLQFILAGLPRRPGGGAIEVQGPQAGAVGLQLGMKLIEATAERRPPSERHRY